MKSVLIVSLFLIVPFSLFSIDETYILGLDDNWDDIAYTDNVQFISGKRGYPDIALQDAEYTVDQTTDLLLHFNVEPPHDSSGHYRVIESSNMITSDYSVYGGRAGLFQNWKGGLKLQPLQNALFYPGEEWQDFTIEFWLYPASLEDGETVLLWNGLKKAGERSARENSNEDQSLPQSLSCSFENRHLVWKFTNFFAPPGGGEYSLTLPGITPLVPKQWHHHSIRFDGSTGLLEYSVDNKPEAIIYASKTREEDDTIYYPYIGSFSSGGPEIGTYYTGILDELRFSRSFVKAPTSKKYTKKKGTAISKPIDFGYSNSRLISLETDDSVPGTSDIYYYYALINSREQLSPNDERWLPFHSEGFFPRDKRGRYLLLKTELFPSGDRNQSPTISGITVTYEPDLPPPPPSLVTAEAGDEQITLQWKPVAEADIAGYSIYYGRQSGRYFGKDAEMGPSPIDIGDKTTVTLEGLENGALYFFTVVAYDSSSPPHFSQFSKEVSGRPTGIGHKKPSDD